MKTTGKMTSVNHNKSGRRDKFCWNCHEKCQKIACSTCFRSFHDKCLRSSGKFGWNNKDKSLVSCLVCTITKTSKEVCVGMERHFGMLKYTMVDILKNPDFRVFKDLSSLNESASYYDAVVNPIDLDDIGEKIDRGFYDSFYEFLVDIECIYHNCYVHYSKRHELTEIAEKLLKFCEHETQAISSCVECYENKHLNPDEWRVMACNKPHLVLWARLRRSFDFWPAKKGFTYWPAKLISVDGEDIKVVFFESSEFIDIPAQGCSIYSTKYSESLNQRFFNQNYIEASLKEVNQYRKNVEKRFGRFQSDLECIKFDPNRLKRHITAMFPDYNGSTSVRPSAVQLQLENDDSVVFKNDELNDEIPVIPEKMPQLLADVGMNTIEISDKLKNDEPNDENPMIPVKRPRLSADVRMNSIEISNKSLPSSIPDTSSLVWEHCYAKKTIEEAMEVMTINMTEMNSNMMSTIDTNIMNLLNYSKSKLLQASSKDVHTKEMATCQAKNEELAYKLQVMTTERDKAKSALIKTNEGHAKPNSIDKATNEELAGKLQAMTSERDGALAALAKVNEDFAKEKERLLELIKTSGNDLHQARRLVNDTLLQSEKTLKITKSNHEIQMAELKTKLEDEYTMSLLKSQMEYDTQNKHLQIKHTIDVNLEKNRVAAEIKKLKMDHNAMVARIHDEKRKELHELKTKLEASHKETCMELQKVLEKEHSNDLAQLKMQHVIEIKKKKDQFVGHIEVRKREHSKQMLAMEKKVQAAVKADLELKYQRTVAGIKRTAELELHQLIAQGKGTSLCMCCGTLVRNVEVWCNEQCAQMWQTWKIKDENKPDIKPY